MRLDGEGLRVDLPTGWEGGITRNPARTRSEPGLRAVAPEVGASDDGRGVEVAEDGSVVMPVTHLANFALPAALDVFGSQAVSAMATGDSFMALVEYGPAEVDTPLFERRGVPRRLAARDFSAQALNRALPDQVGLQVFATESGRAFCLYVVLAGRARLGPTVTAVNTVLSTLKVTPR